MPRGPVDRIDRLSTDLDDDHAAAALNSL